MSDDDAPPPSSPAPEPAPTTTTTNDADATLGATIASNDDDAPVLHRAESSPLPSQHYYNRNVRDEQLALDAARARPTSSLPAWARLGRRNNTAPMPGAGGHRASAATLSESDLTSAIPDRDWLAAALPDPIPAAPTDPAAAGAPVVALTVDRVVTASALEDHLLVLHQLLHRTRHPDPRTDALYLVRAENRYVKWLFMAERLRAAGDESLLVSGRLLPPIDVATMWLAHLTAVRHDTEDIARLFDDALLHVPPPLSKLRDRLELHAHDYEDRASSAMWETFTGEAYTLRFDDESPFYLSCPTCTASVRVECHDYVLLKTDPSFRGIICDGGAAAAAEAGTSNAAPPVIVPGGCGTVLTSGFLSAVRFVNDFKGSLREENVFLAGTLLNPVSGKPNHYLSKQIVQYLAQAPSVAELYSAVLVPLPSPPPSPSVDATAAPGPASSVQAVLDGSTVSTTSGGSASATDPAAGGTAPSSRRASMAASGPASSSLAARRASWATATPVTAPPPQNLDPWRDISNVLFRLEVDLYALEIEDHRLISYHIRAAIERMERCYRDLVTPLSLDLVERVRGYWRVHSGLLVAWTVHAAATLPPALPRDEDEEDDEATVLARDVLSADEADDGDEVAPRTLGRRTRGRGRSRVLTAPTIDVAQAILDVLPQGMVAIRPAKNGGYVLTFDTPPPVHVAADTPTMPTAFPTQDAPATNADAPPPVPLMMPPRAPPAHRGATAVAYKLVPAARAAAAVASAGAASSRRSRSVPALRRALSSASTLDVIPELPLRGMDASDAPLASPTTADAPVDEDTAAAAEDPSNDDEAYVHPPPGDPWDTGRPGIDSAIASSPILHRALSSPSLLAQCTIRYHKMLLLQQRHAGLYASRLALAADMTLCHWTHLLHPPRYIRFCGAHYGRLITYEFASAQAMHAALVNTARRWERRYREPLDAGVVPKLSLADKLAALVDRVVGKLVSTGPI
ncbi:hypothetical protein AMAG_07295 [Allomyces macrogynus ATCC 38327]|uniref:Uncharacterized protein n=1 Tax=Allomyces macrogynus (strain ATCC 38327) TaxID=578462 RepID=A0A0L0SHQ5_ALLM3|nr:hypothetical protein AMAG_07295 [Allomyces macrogynus ATCC 38327]|eukprot:KNE62036.1 hypothetical protein AMAG_07295 [Allomyces macrogynus ATCC 38327]